MRTPKRIGRGTYISVILPTYNEAGNIIKLVHDIFNYLSLWKTEIIISDDDSPDHTASIAQKEFSKDHRVHIIIRKSNRGLAPSICDGIRASHGQFIAVMDTDFNHDPKVLPDMLLRMNTADIVVGSRYIQGGGMDNKIRYVFSLVYNICTNTILHLPVTDCLSGYFVARSSILQSFPLERIMTGYGEYFMRLLRYAVKKGCHIEEEPVYYRNRTYGVSKSKFVSMALNYSKTVLSLLSTASYSE
jgi:dolichol-phosphate mannosyltransferase